MRATRFLCHAAALAATTLLALPAHAGVDSESVALGSQTERADVVVVGRVESGIDDAGSDAVRARVVYTVEAVLRGEAAAGTIVVALDRGTLVGVRGAARTHLLFLARPETGGDHVPLLGPFSVRPLPDDGPAARLPDVVARYAAALSTPETHRSEALCAALVTQMEDDDPGIAWSGATDFYRRGELAESISQEHGRRIVEAFQRLDDDGRAKGALAMAVARCGDPGAAEALADAVDSDAGAVLRGAFGDAAEVMGGQDLAEELATRLRNASPERRLGLVSVLGRVGTESTVDAILPFLRDEDPALRQEALHAAGNIARNVRWIARRKRLLAARSSAAQEPAPEPEAPRPPLPGDPEPRADEPDAPTKPEPDDVLPADSRDWERARARLRIELSRAALRARSFNDKRGSLWALAQLDDPAAYAFLRKLADDETRDDVTRRHAKSYLERPAQSLFLR